MAKQLPLLFEFQANQSFSTYFQGNNAEVVNHLQRLVNDSGEQQIFIWGEAGQGKSHLLQACCQLAQEIDQFPFYFSFETDQLPSPDFFEGLDEIELVCLDNLEQVMGEPEWERAIFNFYNQHRANQHKLIISSTLPPPLLPVQLPDLKTRLNWGLTLRLQPLSHEQAVEALVFKAHCIGFEISPPVGRFLLEHYANDLNSVWALLDKLNYATLSAQRKLTIPFLRQIMESD